MITKNFKALMALILQSSNNNTGTVPVKGVNGTTYYATNNLAFPKNPSLGFTLSETAAGVSFGTSGTAATENDYKLGSAITSGLSASVLHSSKMESDGPASTLKFTVTNTSGSSITIREVGFKQTLAVSSTQGAAGTSSVVCLLDRTVLSTPLTIASGDSAILNYKLKTLTDGSGGGGGSDDPTPSGTPTLTITSMPTRTTYDESTGYTLNLSGLVVTYKDASGSTTNVTNSCTFDPANGSTLTQPTAGSSRTQTVRATYAGLSASFTVIVTKAASSDDTYVNGVKIVPWTTGADADVAAMIDAAHQGTINLQTDGGWRVGDVRSVPIGRYTIPTDHVIKAKTHSLVITSFAKLNNQTNNVMQVDFTAGPAWGISGTPYASSEFVTYHVTALAEAMPSYIYTRLVGMRITTNNSAGYISDQKLALRTCGEILGDCTDSLGNTIGYASDQIDYYKTAANRIKTCSQDLTGSAQGAYKYWTRIQANDQAGANGYHYIDTDGNTVGSSTHNTALAICPFFCL